MRTRTHAELLKGTLLKVNNKENKWTKRLGSLKKDTELVQELKSIKEKIANVIEETASNATEKWNEAQANRFQKCLNNFFK